MRNKNVNLRISFPKREKYWRLFWSEDELDLDEKFLKSAGCFSKPEGSHKRNISTVCGGSWGRVVSQHVNALSRTSTPACTHFLKTQNLAVRHMTTAVGLRASCLSIQTTALTLLIMHFLRSALLAHAGHNLCTAAAAAAAADMRKQWMQLSLLPALTSGESLCGAPTELFGVPVGVVGSGAARVCAAC